jgi:adenylate kinase family enzyme
MSTIINLFGGPGIGKSTQASGLFTEMKKHHMSVEYTYEFPKEVAWEGNISQLKDQFFITANQHRNISRLYGKVDYIIVDSPIVLGCFYDGMYGDGYPTSFYSSSQLSDFLWKLFNEYKNINILLKRNDSVYDQNGRLQNLNEAKEIDYYIEKTLNIKNIEFKEFLVNENTTMDIFNYII